MPRMSLRSFINAMNEAIKETVSMICQNSEMIEKVTGSDDFEVSIWWDDDLGWTVRVHAKPITVVQPIAVAPKVKLTH